MEEVGVSGKQIGLRAAATLVNDDGVSARYIFAGKANVGMIKPSEEIAQVQWFTEETLPECQNRAYMVSAVASARARLDSVS